MFSYCRGSLGFCSAAVDTGGYLWLKANLQRGDRDNSDVWRGWGGLTPRADCCLVESGLWYGSTSSASSSHAWDLAVLIASGGCLGGGSLCIHRLQMLWWMLCCCSGICQSCSALQVKYFLGYQPDRHLVHTVIHLLLLTDEFLHTGAYSCRRGIVMGQKVKISVHPKCTVWN